MEKARQLRMQYCCVLTLAGGVSQPAETDFINQEILFPVVRLRKGLFAVKLNILTQSRDKADAPAVPTACEASGKYHGTPWHRAWQSAIWQNNRAMRSSKC